MSDVSCHSPLWSDVGCHGCHWSNVTKELSPSFLPEDKVAKSFGSVDEECSLSEVEYAEMVDDVAKELSPSFLPEDKVAETFGSVDEECSPSEVEFAEMLRRSETTKLAHFPFLQSHSNGSVSAWFVLFTSCCFPSHFGSLCFAKINHVWTF